jgi:hypothetical protein
VGFSTAYPGLEAPSEEIILNGTSIPGKGFFPRDLNVTVNGTTRDTVCDEPDHWLQNAELEVSALVVGKCLTKPALRRD